MLLKKEISDLIFGMENRMLLQRKFHIWFYNIKIEFF